MNDFDAVFLGEFTDPYDDEYLELWLRFYIETEAFERRICQNHQVDGTAMPRSAGEVKVCQSHAKEVMAQLGLTPTTYLDEKRLVKSMSYHDQRKMLEYLEEKKGDREDQAT